MIPTPHINAALGDFAKTVLMPGDPLRSKFIAENFLDNARLVNNVRGVQGYTGEFGGVPVSVMASGMGMPSMAIYSYELFNFFGVENIIRVGSAGAISPDIKLRDIIIGKTAFTDSAMPRILGFSEDYIPAASEKLLNMATEIAAKTEFSYHVGAFFSTDAYYAETDIGALAHNGALAVEMEAAALYMNAKIANKNALALCAVSNSIISGEELSSTERRVSLTHMIDLALKIAAELEK